MAANRKVKRRFNLDELDDQVAEAFGGIPGMEIELRNGETVTIPHPMLIDDDRQAAVERVRNRLDEDLDEDGVPTGKIKGEPAAPAAVRLAVAILGEDEHTRFLAGGGNSNKVGAAWALMTQGMDAPKH